MKMNVEVLPFENDPEKENTDNNINAVSTENKKKEIRKNVKALLNEDDAKYSGSENMVTFPTEENDEGAISWFDCCNLKFPREVEFFPERPTQNCLPFLFLNSVM